MKLTPLTREQQALCVQWRGLAISYAMRAMKKHGLETHMDEAEGLADESLVRAARVWIPARGSFPACLKWWVFSKVRLYRTHGSLVVSRDREQWEAPEIYRLDAPVQGIRRSATHGNEETWHEIFESPDTEPARLDGTDARRVARAAELAIIGALSDRYSTQRKVDSARVSFEVWARKFSDDEVTFEELGAEYGFSRQAAEQRFRRVQAIFEAWAAGLRAEAA